MVGGGGDGGDVMMLVKSEGETSLDSVGDLVFVEI